MKLGVGVNFECRVSAFFCPQCRMKNVGNVGITPFMGPISKKHSLESKVFWWGPNLRDFCTLFLD